MDHPDDIVRDVRWLTHTIMISFIVFIVICIGILAAVPPVSRDALTHHLAIPKLYLANGGIYEIPDAIASYFPMNIDLLYMIPLMIGNDIGAKYIHFGFALLTAALLYVYLSRRLGALYGTIGILLFLSLPIIVKLSISVYVDLALIFFSFAAQLSLLKWKTSGYRIRFLVISAVLCGAAMGTKYNGIVVCILLVFSTGYIYAQSSPAKDSQTQPFKEMRNASLYCFLYLLIALVVFSPWVIRNCLWTGNPLYPLYDKLFNPSSPYIETSLNPFLIRKLVYQEEWLDILLVPLRIFFAGKDDVPALFDGRLNPYLLILAPIGMLFRGKVESRQVRLEKRIFTGFAILFVIIVYFTRDMRIRYISPAIPALVIISVYGIHNIINRINRLDNRLMKKAAVILCGVAGMICIVQNGSYLYAQFGIVKPIDYLSGKVDRQQYIEEFRPEYAVIRHINNNLPEKAKIFGLFVGNRRYYFDRATIIDHEKFKSIIKTSSTEDDIVNAFNTMHATHIIVGVDHFYKWISANFSESEKRRITIFFNQKVKMLISKNNYILYEIY